MHMRPEITYNPLLHPTSRFDYWPQREMLVQLVRRWWIPEPRQDLLGMILSYMLLSPSLSLNSVPYRATYNNDLPANCHSSRDSKNSSKRFLVSCGWSEANRESCILIWIPSSSWIRMSKGFQCCSCSLTRASGLSSWKLIDCKLGNEIIERKCTRWYPPQNISSRKRELLRAFAYPSSRR